jgi:DNA repair photolyase
MKETVDLWNKPVRVLRNNFVFKSLSSWACNFAIGCGHACRFCYVPEASTIKLGPNLREFGVTDPDAQWGDYVLVRPMDPDVFSASLRKAMRIPPELLNADGNRAVMFCSTTDAYQTIRHPDAARRAYLQGRLDGAVRVALEKIRDETDLNVRILTRSPLAQRDFGLFKTFGNRLLFGMSLPTVDNTLARVYEPGAPAPTQRLKTLRAARDFGLHVYVAVAPTYPEMTDQDLYEVMDAARALDPVTIFHEPINIRAENVKRIAAQAAAVGVRLLEATWINGETWARYSVSQLLKVEALANAMGLAERLHLWPDKSLGRLRPDLQPWLASYWERVSAWPGKPGCDQARPRVASAHE